MEARASSKERSFRSKRAHIVLFKEEEEEAILCKASEYYYNDRIYIKVFDVGGSNNAIRRRNRKGKENGCPRCAKKSTFDFLRSRNLKLFLKFIN